jgi:hypothetical protein
MYFISLGKHCDTSIFIRKIINNNNPTQFFDWVRTDFKAVLHILNLNSIDTLFNIDNIIVDKESYKSEGELCMTLKNFEKDNITLLFHHEIPYNNYSTVELNNKLMLFIDKYKRRFNRLIELIKSDKKLCFIYRINGNFDYENDTDIFNKILININKNINYNLILLIEEKEEEYIYLNYKNYLKINLKNFYNKNFNPNDWITLYDWENIFKLIKDIIKD